MVNHSTPMVNNTYLQTQVEGHIIAFGHIGYQASMSFKDEVKVVSLSSSKTLSSSTIPSMVASSANSIKYKPFTV